MGAIERLSKKVLIPWGHVLRNPNLTVDMIEKNIKKTKSVHLWSLVSCNTFGINC